MRLAPDEALRRLAGEVHGVLCTLHPGRGPAPVPVVYALSDAGPDAGPGALHVGVPVDTVKPKSTTRLRREADLEADPRAALLVEHWDAGDWTRLWWVRAELHHVPDPPAALVEGLASRLAVTVAQYADRPFDHVLVCSVVALTGWSAADA